MNSITIKQTWTETRVWEFTRQEFFDLFALTGDLATLTADQREAVWGMLTEKRKTPLTIPKAHMVVNGNGLDEQMGEERLLEAIYKVLPKLKKK